MWYTCHFMLIRKQSWILAAALRAALTCRRSLNVFVRTLNGVRGDGRQQKLADNFTFLSKTYH